MHDADRRYAVERAVPIGVEPSAVLARAMESERVRRVLEGRRVVKEIYVPGRMLSLVTAPATC